MMGRRQSNMKRGNLVLWFLAAFSLMLLSKTSKTTRRILMLQKDADDTTFSLLQNAATTVDDKNTSPSSPRILTSIQAPPSPRPPRVAILTVWTNYPDLLKLHVRSLRTFLQLDDGYELDYIAILNSHHAETNDALMQTCEALNVTHLSIDILPSTDASRHHAHALNQALHHYILSPHFALQSNDDIVFFLDADIFPMHDINLNQLLRRPNRNNSTDQDQDQVHLVSIPQTRGHHFTYLWPNFLLLQLPSPDMYRDLNFNPGTIRMENEHYALDSGGATYQFLQKYTTQLNSKWIRTNSDADCKENDASKLCTFYRQQATSLQFPSNTSSCRVPELLILSDNQDDDDKTAMFYHLASAASNWRRCPEAYLAARRRDLAQYLEEAAQEVVS